jgi:hypothetical protein
MLLYVVRIQRFIFFTVISPSCICIDTLMSYYSFFMDDLCNRWPFAFIRLLYIAVIERSARSPAATNRYPIVDSLSLIFVEIFFNRLSNVRLLHGIVIRPQAIASLRLYWQQPIIRKVCKALLESGLNPILPIKYLRITSENESLLYANIGL